jgi:hypothetical protein
MMLPGGESHIDTFIHVCITVDPRKFGYNFQILFHAYVVHGTQSPYDYNYVRYKVLKKMFEIDPRGLLSCLRNQSKTPGIFYGFQVSMSKVKKFSRMVACWTEASTKPANVYSQVYDEIVECFSDGVLSMLMAAGMSSAVSYEERFVSKQFYEKEIYLSALPYWKRLLELFAAGGDQLNSFYLTTIMVALLKNGRLVKEDAVNLKAELLKLSRPETEAIEILTKYIEGK